MKPATTTPRIIAWILLIIGCIYQIETRLREQRAGSLERQKARWLESLRLYDHLAKLFKRLESRRSITPRSKLGAALAYATNQWPYLEPCFIDGQIEFDNDLT